MIVKLLQTSSNLQKILNRVRADGNSAYERYINVAAFAQFLSFFDSEISSMNYDSLGSPTASRGELK